ncbi:hypothetical protein [Candidatus Weimeria sp. HCP3S3_B5]|uniref:hypothetical protein n=1 Tax=Candidatus Weimeria sp. HCP3S3_B5 TaxID=3438871 RepID=UPI003034E33F|nr:hypothetical protein [Lachnospiraceae bacterium]
MSQARPHRGRLRVVTPKKQYTLTMRPDMYDRAKKAAEEKGTSFSGLVSDAVVYYLKLYGIR